MECNLITLKKIGEIDDIFVSVTIKKNELNFCSGFFWSFDFCQIQAEKMTNFLSDLSLMRHGFTLDLDGGVNSGTAQQCKSLLEFQMQRKGKFLIRSQLSERISSKRRDIYDRCVVHLGADLASLDSFAKELSMFATSESITARIETFDLTDDDLA